MKYNIGLSDKRAQAIKDYLVDKGIDSSRITTKGLGYLQPIADNETPEGRALNRRAEIIPVK
jgi:OOP family OmpA-OmpF porin